jgi:hypothetical protein
MKRMGAVGSAGWRALAGLGLALTIAAVPHTAFAQDAPAASQADPLKFSVASPVQILIQIHADKAAEFESLWAALRENVAKSTVAEHTAFNATLTKLYKVDQPPIDGANGAKIVIYVLPVEQPVTNISYSPAAIIWEILYKTGEGSILKYEEANALFEKLKTSLAGMQLWKLNKIGG